MNEAEEDKIGKKCWKNCNTQSGSCTWCGALKGIDYKCCQKDDYECASEGAIDNYVCTAPAQTIDPMGGSVFDFLKRAAFTASVQGKITLAIHLSKDTWGLIDFSLTMTVAAALRKGDVPHKGLYLTIDLTSETRVEACKVLKDSAAKAAKLINGAKESVDKAKEYDTEGVIDDSITLTKFEQDAITKQFEGTKKLGAMMQIYIRDIDNFGFKWR